MAGTVFAEHMNEHVLLKLLADLHATLDDRAVWGTHLGSETLMRGHKNASSRIACIAALEKRKSELELREKQDQDEDTMSMEEHVTPLNLQGIWRQGWEVNGVITSSIVFIRPICPYVGF